MNMYEIDVLPKHSGDFTIERGISTNRKMYSSQPIWILIYEYNLSTGLFLDNFQHVHLVFWNQVLPKQHDSIETITPKNGGPNQPIHFMGLNCAGKCSQDTSWSHINMFLLHDWNVKHEEL